MKVRLGKTVAGTVIAISLCTLVFWGGVRAVYGAEMSRLDTLPPVYGALTEGGNLVPTVPEGYAKTDYTVTLGQYSEVPTATDITKEEAAEIGVQDLWRIFGTSMEGKTVEMSYFGVSEFQPRAQWSGIVTVDENRQYSFWVDAVTGERLVTQQSKYWDTELNLGMDVSLLTDHEEYDALAREVAEKYLSDAGKIVSVEYGSQGYSSNVLGNSNPDVQMFVKFEDGQEAQISFSRYNKDLLYVAYDAWVKDAKVHEQRAIEMAEEAAAAAGKVVIQEGEEGGFFLITQ